MCSWVCSGSVNLPQILSVPSQWEWTNNWCPNPCEDLHPARMSDSSIMEKKEIFETSI